MRFTIRSLMFTVMVVALALGGLVAIPWEWRVAGLIVAFPCVALFGVLGLAFRRNRKAAACWFAGIATSVNVLYVAVCLNPDASLLTIASLAWFFMVVPLIVALGASWAMLATRSDAVPQRSPEKAAVAVFALTVAPLITVLTLWPLHLYFLAARPTLDRLADQAAAGQPWGGPRWIGVVRLAGAKADPATGDVALFTEPSLAHPAGFVRRGTRPTAAGGSRTIAGSNLELPLWSRWSFREDD